jgi:hypothetical protein
LRQALEDDVQNILNKQKDSNPDWLIFSGFSEPPQLRSYLNEKAAATV